MSPPAGSLPDPLLCPWPLFQPPTAPGLPLLCPLSYFSCYLFGLPAKRDVPRVLLARLCGLLCPGMWSSVEESAMEMPERKSGTLRGTVVVSRSIYQAVFFHQLAYRERRVQVRHWQREHAPPERSLEGLRESQ